MTAPALPEKQNVERFWTLPGAVIYLIVNGDMEVDLWDSEEFAEWLDSVTDQVTVQ